MKSIRRGMQMGAITEGTSNDEKWAADALNTRQTEVRNFRSDEGKEEPEQFPQDITEQLRKLSKS